MTNTVHQQITHHGQRRMQQRCISTAMVDCLLEFGESRYAGRGAESYFFTARSWRHLEKRAPEAARNLERCRNAYAVIASNGSVITAAWRH